jgi:anti-sigma regulatory factor (Ser/Thr protein kinase)
VSIVFEGIMPMKASISVRSETAEWPLVRSFAEDFAARHGLSRDERARLLIVLEELLTNLSKYGYDAGAPSGSAEIGLGIDALQLTIEFSDDGRPFDPLAHRPTGLSASAESRQIGGLGLHIVRSFTRNASYVRDHGRNRLRLTRDLAGDPAGRG